jgi:hypothetical protein
MGVFRNSRHFYECVGELMDRAKKDPAIGPKIAKSGIIIQFRYTDLKPDVVMTMKADVSYILGAPIGSSGPGREYHELRRSGLGGPCHRSRSGSGPGNDRRQFSRRVR